MGLLILLSSGAVLGWLVSLMTGADTARAAWLRVGLGSAVTVLSGVIVSEAPLLETLGARALLVAVATGGIVLALVTIAEPMSRR